MNIMKKSAKTIGNNYFCTEICMSDMKKHYEPQPMSKLLNKTKILINYSTIFQKLFFFLENH